MAKHYNYFRDYDPAIGRYIESDPIGIRVGTANTYSYVLSQPLRLFDLLGLTEADIQGIWRDVLSSFADLDPASKKICFRPLAPGNMGETQRGSGQICIDPSWARKSCLAGSDFNDLFFTLFHEGMHSTDNWFVRVFESDSHHDSIYNRELYERFGNGNPKYPAPSPMWGSPRDHPVDMDRLYKQYRARTPACCGNR